MTVHVHEPSREAAEHYRRASMSLMNALRGRGRKTVMFTSSTAGEGTTTAVRHVSRHLATDCRLRTLTVTLNHPFPSSVDGAQAVVAERCAFGSLEKMVTRDSYGVDQIAGPGPDNPEGGRPVDAALLGQLLKSAEDRYDVVLIDAPPLLTSSEAFEAAGLVQNLVLVVRAEKTRYEVLERVKGELEQQDVKIIGTILNGRKRYIPRWIYSWLFQ